jgi:mannose-1-phosphate guanylyltransferase
MKIVLLAAGMGSRLWPLSTAEKPKQFQDLLGTQTMLQYTYDVFRKLTNPSDIYVLTLEGLDSLVSEQIPHIPDGNILAVPERRNTLPHTLFALRALTTSDNEAVLFTSTDSYIPDQSSFLDDLRPCLTQENTGQTTLVCTPARVADPTLGYANVTGGKITSFVEKPSLETLERMLEEGALYANSCTYITSIAAIRKTFPLMDSQAAEQASAFLEAGEETRKAAFLAMALRDISTAYFSYATDVNACVTRSEIVDLGSFSALYSIGDKDGRGNVVSGNVLLEGDCSNNLVINKTDAPLVVIDTSDTAVVQTPWGSLFSPLSKTGKVGEVYKSKLQKQ